jgi:hypothetical protein
MCASRVGATAVSNAGAPGTDSPPGRLFLPLLILLATIAVLVRIDHWSFIGESLFAEDANLFIDEAHELGLRALLVPWLGYLFLYERAVGLLATAAPLAVVPYIFFCAWVFSFAVIAVVVTSRAKSAGLNELTTTVLVCAIALQPNYGEAFFNLNMAAYMFGIALAFHVCIPKQDPSSVWVWAFLVVATLTGPTSAFLIPVLVLQLIMLRDFAMRSVTYVLVIIGGLIQGFLLLTQRASGFTGEASATDWIQAISSFLLFGGGNKLTCVAAISFWLILSTFLIGWLARNSNGLDRVRWASPLFAAIAMLLMYFAGAWGAKSYMLQNMLPRLSPTDMNARWLLIPYSLVFFIALVCTRDHRRVQTVVIALISLICGAGFMSVDRAERRSHAALFPHNNLQWTAFTRFREIRPDVAIPVNPVWPVYPPLFSVDSVLVGVGDGVLRKADAPILLRDRESMAGGGAVKTNKSLVFDIERYCVTSRYLGFEIDIWRSRMGWARLSWGPPVHSEPHGSLERFYPDGEYTMQFAFRRDLSDSVIRLDPSEGVDEAVVQTLSPLREPLRKSGVMLAEPTEPGGEVRVDAVRLYCLGPQSK